MRAPCPSIVDGQSPMVLTFAPRQDGAGQGPPAGRWELRVAPEEDANGFCRVADSNLERDRRTRTAARCAYPRWTVKLAASQ